MRATAICNIIPPEKDRFDMTETNRQLGRWVLWLKILIALQVLLLIISLPGQRVHGDEAAFAEFAYWQSEEGFVRSEQFRGLAGYEIQILLYHKLFEALGALMILIFGYGLWPLRALSLIATAVIVFLWWRDSRSGAGSGGAPPNQLGFLIAVAFLLSSPLSFLFAKYYRPELIQAAFGLASFIALGKALARKHSRLYLLAGALAGASMLTHLNGVIYVVAGFGLLVVSRQWRATALYSIAAIGVFSLFFVDILFKPDLFWWQYVEDPTFFEGERTIWGSLIKLLEEHKRLFRKPEIIFTSVLFFAAYFTALAYRRREQKNLLIYLAFLIITLGALAPAKTTPYAILLFPFFAMQVALIGDAIIRKQLVVPGWLRAGLAVCAAAFVLHSFGANALNAFTDKQDWVGDNREVAAELTPGIAVLAHMDFVLNEVENFRILGLRLPRWRLCDWSDQPYTFERLAHYADTSGIDAIILDPEERRNLLALPTELGATTGPYRLVRKFDTSGLWLWKREPRDGS